MRIPESSSVHGSITAQRRQLVLDFIAEQQVEIDKVMNGLFSGAIEAANQAYRPRSYWNGLARDNARNPATSPIDFWANQEAQRRQRAEAESRNAFSTLFATGATPRQNKVGVNAGLSPVDFARGGRPSNAYQPKIGLPPPPPIKTVTFESIVQVQSNVISAIGRIIDVFA